MNRTILITGGSRGLGLSCVRHFAKLGWNIAITDLSDEACNVYGELESIDILLNDLNKDTKVDFISANLTIEDEAESMINYFIGRYKKIDAVVNFAGGDIKGDDDRASGGKCKNNTILADNKDFLSVFNRNFLTTLYTCRSLIPHMKSNNFGKILNVSSVSAGIGVDKETSYSISKASIIHLTRCLAVELREHGINVNCIAPSATNTGRFQATLKHRTKQDLIRLESKNRLERIAEPEDICKVVEFFISPASDFVSGQILRVDGGQFTSAI